MQRLLVAAYLKVHVVSLDDPADDCPRDVGEDLLDVGLPGDVTASVILMTGSHPAQPCSL